MRLSITDAFQVPTLHAVLVFSYLIGINTAFISNEGWRIIQFDLGDGLTLDSVIRYSSYRPMYFSRERPLRKNKIGYGVSGFAVELYFIVVMSHCRSTIYAVALPFWYTSATA